MKTRIRTKSYPPGRHEERFSKFEHGTYRLYKKIREPSVCPGCGAVYRHGRWQWSVRPEGAEEVKCVACRRIAAHFPAGYLYIDGEFAAQHRDELLSVLRHHEEYARVDHPMKRIMAIEEAHDQIEVTTTDIHLARELGDALHAAFHGTLQLKYSKDEKMLMAYWRR